LARPLVSKVVSDREPDSDLNSEDFSARPEDEDRESDRDLYSELFSATLEDEPSEALKINALPPT